jgi:hypothetical protein
LAALLHAIFAANALLALVELATKWQLTPLVLDGVLIDDPRSTALFGHPLENASTTGLYIIALAVGGGRDLPRPLRLAQMGLQLAAMIPFGGRAASVALLAVLAILLARQVAHALAGARFRPGDAALVVILVPLLVAGAIIAYDQGFFDILLARFVEDNGSARTRLTMFTMFQHFPWSDLLFGPDQKLLRSLMWTEGTEYGIESFPLALMLTYGIVPTLLLLAGLAVFLVDIVLRTRGRAAWPVLFFLAVAVTSLSIGAKTLGLGQLVALCLILLRSAPVTSPARAGLEALQRDIRSARTG